MRPGSRAPTRLVCVAATMLAALAGCDESPGEPPQPSAFAAVSAGGRHTCAVAATGSVHCWGRNEAGELGDATFENSTTPRPVAFDTSFEALDAGSRHTCALTAEGALYCWGWNFHGQLGNASTIDQGSPVPIATELRFLRVSSGWLHTCALTRAGEAWCWGSNEQGQLGDGTTTNRTSPVRVSAPRFTDITAGGYHTCGLTTAGAVLCWGLNQLGQLGAGSTVNATRPVAVAGGMTFRDVSAGFQHTCAIEVSGTAYCWGANEYGELGVAGTSPPGQAGHVRPAAVHGDLAFDDLEAGLHYTCAIENTLRGHCWGRGFEGQLGNGAFTNWSTPQPVAEVAEFSSLSAGGDTHACGITGAGAIFCWGTGTLGVAGVRASALPVRLPGV